MHAATDTIVAIATAPAPGGVGIVRLSGSQAWSIAQRLTWQTPLLRRVQRVQVHDADNALLDDGIALAFRAPASFTGEDVVELQLHGSVPLLQAVVDAACRQGARRARAGEFSERAFHNGKLDLAQSEAIADMIAAQDIAAARAARRSLEGVFSAQVDALAQRLLALRVQVEAAIDFADEPIDTLGTDRLLQTTGRIADALQTLLQQAEQGRRLRDGLHVVIVGPPNAGKSSLLNALAGMERAIVSATAGTTRDVLQETVRIGGLELTLVDTAGLRDSGDAIEREGIRRARAELQRADLALVVIDATANDDAHDILAQEVAVVPQVLWLHNKADLLADAAPLSKDGLRISAHTGDGLAALRTRLIELAGRGAHEGAFSARARHVQALQHTATHVADAIQTLQYEQPELAAESLRLAHDALGDITGRTLPDALLGHIFSTFCIGK